MTNQAFKTNIKNTIKYLFVDEYQDINPIQEKIIEEFHNLGVKICAVGDDDQTIYQFRGSDSSIIRNFTKKYNVSEKYEFILDYNFRSTDKIVSLSNTLIKHNVQRIAKNVKIGNHNPKFEQNDISYYTPGNEEEEYDFICKKILFFKKTGYNFSDISILSRTNGSISKISNYLKKFNIPFNVKGFNNLFEYEEIMALSEIFQQLICQNINKDNFIQLLKTINNNATKKNLEDALKLISNTMLSLSTLKVFNMQVFYHELIMNLGISEEIGNADHEIKMYALGKFSTLISDFEMINYNSLPESKIKNFSWFLEHDAKTGYSDGMNENTCNQNNSVNVMTVHASKGLEFPIVFILDLNEGRFPNTRLMTDVLLFNYIDEEKIENSQRYIVDIEDERKLFYVAITRSMKHLILTTSTKKHSMFLDECLKSKLVTPDNLTNYEIHNIVKTKLSNTPIILNFSVLQDYFNCPYKFKLSFLYGFASEFSDT
jgi:DNA helicase-2/ATP-dependent DNA helicase PcrA